MTRLSYSIDLFVKLIFKKFSYFKLQKLISKNR
jgi:hypothetical protein